MVSAAFKTVFAQVSGADMHAQWDRVVTTLEGRFPEVRPHVGAKEEVLAFTAFPEHWRRSGRPTRSSASTRRSSAGPTWSASFRTTSPSNAW